MRNRIAMALTAFAALGALMCSKGTDSPELDIQAVRITLKMSGPRYEGTFYRGFLPRNDYGVWIEDAGRRYVRTLQITPTVVTVDTVHGQHCDHLPAWMASSGVTYAGLQAEIVHGLAPSFADAVTSASPYFATDSSHTFTCTWDLKNRSGAAVAPGVFYAVAESGNIRKNDEATIEILAEHTFAKMDLVRGTAEPGAATANIESLEVSFILADGTSLAKRFDLLGPR
jgi:hypothetical protein